MLFTTQETAVFMPDEEMEAKAFEKSHADWTKVEEGTYTKVKTVWVDHGKYDNEN